MKTEKEIAIEFADKVWDILHNGDCDHSFVSLEEIGIRGMFLTCELILKQKNLVHASCQVTDELNEEGYHDGDCFAGYYPTNLSSHSEIVDGAEYLISVAKEESQKEN